MDIKNEDPNVVIASATFLEQFGWYIVICIVLIFVVWNKIKPTIKSSLSASASRPSTDVAKLEDVRRARAEALQREYDEKARVELEKRLKKEKEMEEAKRLEKIQNYENFKSGKSSKVSNDVQEIDSDLKNGQIMSKKRKDGSSLRNPEWNPLTGASSSSCNFRPSARRGPASGG